MSDPIQPPPDSLSFNEIVDRSKSAKLIEELKLPSGFAEQWVATPSDQDFAWDLYTEFRTRIATQPLHYMHGKEKTALKSIYELFPMIRELIHDKGRTARNTVTLSLFMINKVVRPFTAKWDGRINPDVPLGEDDGTKFRRELDDLQVRMRSFASLLACIAEQRQYVRESESWPTKASGDSWPKKVESPKSSPRIPFGIEFHPSVPKAVAAQISQAEMEAILSRRKAIDPPVTNDPPVSKETLEDVAGLSISGGGIRSASFALGVVQELSRHNILQHFDYLSTVSGGGYLGAFLSSYLNGPPGKPSQEQVQSKDIGLGSRQLPLNRPNQLDVGQTNEEIHRAQSESAPIRHLRGHSKYLLTGGLANRLSMVVLGAFGILANLIILLPIVAGILLSVVAIRPQVIENLRQNPTPLIEQLLDDKASVWTLATIPLMIVSLSVVFSVARLLRLANVSKYWLGCVSLFVPIALLFVLWRMLPGALWQAERLFHSKQGSGFSTWFNSLASVSAVVMFLQRYWALLNANPSMSKFKRIISIVVLALFGPLFLLVCLYLLGHFTLIEPVGEFKPFWLLLSLTVGPFIFGLLFLDINQSSLHPFYRRKLCEAFLIAKKGSGESTVSNDTLKLSEMRTRNQSGPYHLINAALNAPSSDNGVMRERGTDFFLFSQAYTGSASTGYYKTTEWEKGDWRLNLGTAMAISGAAASPVMGVVPLPSAKFLLALFNVRLDFWLAVPNRPTIPLLWWTPGPWYLIRQAIGWMDETTTFVNVSDGGHIENLGLYELLRRRCRYIVVIDGECDPNLGCGAFMQAARYAKLDFGVEVDIGMDRFKPHQDGSAKYHFSFGKIRYPNLNQENQGELEGRIVYIKLSRTGNEPAGVEHYRLKNPDFPHQSTADQLFDEAQFEAYRCLGEHVAEDIFQMTPLESNQTSRSRLAKWFQQIEAKLTDPMES